MNNYYMYIVNSYLHLVEILTIHILCFEIQLQPNYLLIQLQIFYHFYQYISINCFEL